MIFLTTVDSICPSGHLFIGVLAKKPHTIDVFKKQFIIKTPNVVCMFTKNYLSKYYYCYFGNKKICINNNKRDRGNNLQQQH